MAGRTLTTALSAQDLANLLIEAPDTPMQMGVLMILEGGPLLDATGDVDLRVIGAKIDERLDQLPELRQVLRAAGPLGTRAVWVQDPSFAIREHVKGAEVPPPGGERELLITVAGLIGEPLPRSRPLWEMWFLTGLAERRLAVLLTVHHAVTDGLGMLRIVDVLLDPEARPAQRRRPRLPPPARPPFGTPVRGTVSTALAVLSTLASGAEAAARPRPTALNRPIGAGRRLAVVRFELDAVKEVAHRHSVKVGDVVLHLVASGVRAGLRAQGVDTEGAFANALLAVDPRRPGDPALHRNQAGSLIVPLPLGSQQEAQRLAAIALEVRRARARQQVSVMERLMVMTVLSGLGRPLSRRQSVVQVAVSNLIGPDHPIYLLGARLLDAIPITPISGSVTIDFCALSYAGRFDLVALAEMAAWPELESVAAGVRAGWDALTRLP